MGVVMIIVNSTMGVVSVEGTECEVKKMNKILKEHNKTIQLEDEIFKIIEKKYWHKVDGVMNDNYKQYFFSTGRY